MKLWEWAGGNEFRTLTGHRGGISSCAFSPDGHRIVSAPDDHTLKLWDSETGIELATFTGHSDGVLVCAFSPDGRYVVSASRDQSLKVWDIGSGEEVCHTGAAVSWISHVTRVLAWSPDAGRIVLGTASGEVLLLEPHGLDGVFG